MNNNEGVSIMKTVLRLFWSIAAGIQIFLAVYTLCELLARYRVSQLELAVLPGTITPRLTEISSNPEWEGY